MSVKLLVFKLASYKLHLVIFRVPSANVRGNFVKTFSNFQGRQKFLWAEGIFLWAGGNFKKALFWLKTLSTNANFSVSNEMFTKKFIEDQKKSLKRQFVVRNLKVARRIVAIPKAFSLTLFKKIIRMRKK